MKVVGEASSGDGVLGKVEECRPDCILMDINLPGKNGIEATELVKKLSKLPSACVYNV